MDPPEEEPDPPEEEPDVVPLEEPAVLPLEEPVEPGEVMPLEELPGGLAVVLLEEPEPAWLLDAGTLEERSTLEVLEDLEELEDLDAAVGAAPPEEPEEPPEEPEELLLDAGAAPPPPPRMTLEAAVALGVGAGTNFGPDFCCAPKMITATNNTTATADNSQFIKEELGGCIDVSIHAYLEILFHSHLL